MVTIGVVLGLSSALAHSLAYVFSRVFVTGRRRGVLRLMALGHLMMGLICLAGLPFLWTEEVPPLGDFIFPLMGWVSCYLVGQALLFLALHRSDASRISPLLSLKILVLAVVTVGILRGELSLQQWSGVGLAVAGAFVLNYSGGKLSRLSVAAVLVACIFYATSDLSIVELVRALEVLGRPHASAFGVCLGSVICGLIGLAILPLGGRETIKDALYAIPYALCWLAGIALIFACFAYVGAVFGNILQSTRGLFSIVIGAQLARIGLVHIETKTSRSVVVRRLVAAAMMTAAIAVYLLG